MAYKILLASSFPEYIICVTYTGFRKLYSEQAYITLSSTVQAAGSKSIRQFSFSVMSSPQGRGYQRGANHAVPLFRFYPG